MNIKDQVAIVVGASSGMGRATAKTFAAAGARVVLAARSADKLEALAAEIGGEALACPTDARDVSQVEALIEMTAER